MADDTDSRKAPGAAANGVDPMSNMPGANLKSPAVETTPTRDSYWFAHGGPEEVKASNTRNAVKSPDSKDNLSLKEREEKMRLFRVQQEGERLRRMVEMEQSFQLSRKFREQQEEERKRKIEEARLRENERRQQVEERKRQIWEAERERKEAIMRRNMERESRIEARRNAQRNSFCFAFGSSTPRTFDLDLAALGRNSSVGSPLMSSVSGKRADERETGPKRATSACSLDRKPGDDCMSWSMVSLSSSSRGRRRTDLTPVAPRERSTTPHSTKSRGNASLRAVSMTRLDQLAQPRRRFFEARDPTYNTGPSTTPTGPHTVSSSMSKSMCNLANTHQQPSRKFQRPQTPRNDHFMSRSMLHLPGSTPKYGPVNPPRFQTSPTSPPPNGNSHNKLRSAQSMTHLAIAPPRLTRAARLRAHALTVARMDGQTASMMNLSKVANPTPDRFLMSAKDSSCSPSRPLSSMSGRSEVSISSSQTSSVSLRPRPAPRKPRPVSIAGTTVDRSTWNSGGGVSGADRKPRLYERNVRAKSNEPENPIKITLNRKPVPPPKSAQVLAKARSHPVPTKDNLRKNVKVVETPKISDKPPSSSETVSPPEPKPNVTLLPTSAETIAQASEEPVVPPVAVDPSNASAIQATNKQEAKLQGSIATNKVQVELITLGEQPSSREGSVCGDGSQAKPRITSEEEARIALAEKRRLAREQAEKEAELERQRQEELKRQEEERKRLEELEQKRFEEEQIRLAALHRQMEEEKLKKAIEEQQLREQEEQERRDEEARLKAEKDELEKRAREEAEKQRVELEEKLRKEEQERAERKRRVEQIMSRTRGKGSQSVVKEMPSPAENNSTPSIPPAPQTVSNNSSVISSSHLTSSSTETTVQVENITSAVTDNAGVNFASKLGVQSLDMPTQQPFDVGALVRNVNVQNGFHIDNAEQPCLRPSVVNGVPNRTSNTDSSCNLQTNGYSSHEDSSSTSSPEERSEKSSDSSEGMLLDLQPSRPMVHTNGQRELNQLIDINADDQTTRSHNDNYVIDVVNSNIVSSNTPFLAFEDNLPKKQENAYTDLLS